MSKFPEILIAMVLGLLLTACGASGGHFRLEGKFLHFNQGELYVYSLDGSIEGLDTIKVDGGRFTYEIPCAAPTTLMLVFPNYSEQPVFAEPGKAVDVKADASHLKELRVEGSKENKLMNEFREMIATASPPEERRMAELFIGDHPESHVSVYLVRRYYVMTATPDYDKAQRLLKPLQEAQPKNGALARLAGQVRAAKSVATGKPLPRITTKDIDGKPITAAQQKADILVVSTWADWNYESKNMQRQLRKLRRQRKDDMKMISICMDPSEFTCRRTMRQDTIDWPVVWTGRMLDDPTLRQLSMTSIPGNILVHKGKVIATGLSQKDLIDKINQLH